LQHEYKDTNNAVNAHITYKTREGSTECDVFGFLREAETVGLGKMS